MFTGIARSVGDSKKPLLFLLISVAVNLVLDLLFVAHFGWGVAGAAWATLISQIVAAVSAGIYVFRGIPVLQLKARMLVPTAKRTRRQLALGIPVSLQFTITSIGSMILQSAVNGFGANVVAAFTAAGRAESITNIPMSNLAVAASTFVAQNYGAGQYRRILTTVRKVFVVDLGLSVLCSLVLFFGGEQIVGLFMTDYNSQIVYAAKEYLFAISLCYSLVSVLFVLRNTLQGAGLYLCKCSGRRRRVNRQNHRFVSFHTAVWVQSCLFCRSCGLATCRPTPNCAILEESQANA